ncbi:MAG: PQQ-like beta-propeller repeat protein [Planctomycetes bacterium]|nr:PQQ-like beta-propeller repeat protein [Planctomycetota bacterium]
MQSTNTSLAVFDVLDITTGTPSLSMISAPSQGPALFGACVSNGRLFVPGGMGGAGSGTVNEFVEAWDLTTGALLWTWTGVNGTAQTIQEVPPTATGAERLILMIADHPVPPFNWITRALVLDPTASSLASAVACATPDVVDLWSPSPLSILTPPGDVTGATWRAFAHDQPLGGGTHMSKDIRDISLATCTSVPPGVPTPDFDFTGTGSLGSNSLSNCPLVIDATDRYGFVVDTAGKLHAYDFTTAGPGIWTSTASTASALNADQFDIALLDAAQLCVVLHPAAPDATTLIAYDFATGGIAWTASLPAAPTTFGWCVLDGDVLLAGLVNGDVVAVSAAGGVTSVHHEPGVNPAVGVRVVAAEGRFFVSVGSNLICYEPTAGPHAYGAAKQNSKGCVPAIAVQSGVPSVANPAPFEIVATNVINKKFGLLFYGYSKSNAPFQGGTLLVGAPQQRSPVLFSGGNPLPNDCSGKFVYDFNARIQSGADPELVEGASVYCQYWYRDNGASFGTGLTDALCFSVGP